MKARHLFDQYMKAAEPKEHREVLDLFIAIRPHGKERTHGSHHSTPEKTRNWEAYVGTVTASDMMKGRKTITFPVAARVIFGVHKNRADIDNLEKAIWDGLQHCDRLTGQGAALANDSLIRGYVSKCEIAVEKGEEFVWVRFYALDAHDFLDYNASNYSSEGTY